MNNLHVVPPGHTISASIFDGKGYIRQVENPAIGGIVTNAAVVTYGPYGFERKFTTQGNLTVTIAEAETTLSIGQKAVLDAIPTVDQGDSETIWADNGSLKVSGAGG